MAKIKNLKPIGKITHYFSEIKVAVVKLSGPLKVGDEIRITGGESTDFNQKIKSMQVDHKAVKTAKKGKSVGLKVDEKVREGYLVFKA
jgi:putative protease